jgi:hypothetical protein
VANAVLTCAAAALDRATDEILTNFGGSADTGRWLTMCATLEREEISDTSTDLPHIEGVGTLAPLASGGAFSGVAKS